MPEDKDFYQILGLEPTASDEEVKQAYRKLVRELHPDINPEEEERMKDVNAAYAVLGDPEKRSQYDSSRMGPSDFHTVLNHIFRPRARAAKNTSIRVGVTMNLPELLTGGQREITFTRISGCKECGGLGGRRDRCDRCGGTGQGLHSEGFMQIHYPCNACGGTGSRVVENCGFCHGRGLLPTEVTRSVNIPSGFNNTPILFDGEGNAEIIGVPPGDLVVVGVIREDHVRPFNIAGHDVTMPSVFVDPVTFLVGGDVVVDSPFDETVGVRIEPKTEFGKTMVIHGKGMPIHSGVSGSRGNLFVRFIPSFPDDLDMHQWNLLQQYAEARRAGPKISDEEVVEQEVV